MRYRFAGFELDSDAYKLCRGDREIHLQPLVFDVLHYLVQHRERVVGKDELLEALWSDGTGNDAAVTWSISHVRRALEQSRWQKAPIETIHGRGYRFVSPVTVIERPAPAQPLDPKGARPVIGSTLPFVGRDEIMGQLHAQLLAAEQGTGNLTVLIGEAGIGKTRCANAVAAVASARGFLTLSASSVEGVGAPVFYPWQQVLRSLGHAQLALRPPANALLAQLSAAGSGNDARETGGWSTRPMHSVVSGSRVRLFDSVVQLLVEASRLMPLFLSFDDLHWADAGTIELLSFAAPELAQGRLMVLATQRQQGETHNARALASLSLLGRHLPLPYLTGADISQYIAEYTHQKEPPSALSAAVLAATAGNPLFVQETVRSLLAEHPGDALDALSPGSIRPSKLARDILRRPLGKLSSEEYALLSTAAVLGETFELTLLKHVTDLDIEPLLDRLETAHQLGFVQPEAPNRYRFTHALIRTILYDDVRPAERVVTHRRTAEMLSKAPDADHRLREIAIHYYKALPAADAAAVTRATVRAANAAEEVSAFDDATMFYQWALESHALEPSGDTRARTQLLVRCGRAQRLAGREDDARRTLESAIVLGSKHGYSDILIKAAGILRPTHAQSLIPDLLVRSALEQALQTAPEGPHPQRIHALCQLACLPPIALDLEQSKQTSALALSLARERIAQLEGGGRSNGADGRTTLFEALRARLYSLSGPDDIDALLEVCDELLALDRPNSDISWRAQIARYGALLLRGDIRAARTALDASLHLSRELQLPEATWHSERLQAQALFAAGRFSEARAALRALRAQSARLGLGYGPGLLLVIRGAVEWEMNGAAQLRQHVDTWNTQDSTQTVHSVRAYAAKLAADCGALDVARRNWNILVQHEFSDVPKESSYLLTLSNAAQAAVLLGDLPRAERLYELLSPYPEHNTPDMVLLAHGSVSRALALLAAALGRDERVEEHFETALAMNARMEYLPQLARTHHDYARWLFQRNSSSARAHARDQARQASQSAQQLGMAWVDESLRSASELRV